MHAIDPATLYALALAAGTSLDPGDCARTFLQVLVDTLGLDGAAVHARRGASGETGPVDALDLLASEGEPVPLGARSLAAAQEAPGISTSEAGGAACVAAPLGGVGVLTFHRAEPVRQAELDALGDVVDKLGVGLRGAFAHHRLQRQTAEREAAEAEQRLNAERLAALIRHNPAAIVVEDAERRMRLANVAFCEVFGIDAPPEALLGADCAAAAEASAGLFEDPDGFLTRVGEVLRRREAVTGEEIRMADGRVVERDYVPVVLDGAPFGHLWEYRDVTERHRHAEEVDGLRMFYEQVLGAMPAQLAVFDLDGRYRYVTPSAIGDPAHRAEVIGLTVGERARRQGLSEAVAQRREAAVAEAARAQQTVRFEESIELPGEGRRHFIRFLGPILDEAGRTVQVLGYGLDVTELKQAEEAARRSEALKRGVFESALDAVITVDRHGRVLEFNPAAEAVFGRRAADVLGEEMGVLIVPERFRAAHSAGMERYLRTGEGPMLGRRIVMPALRADGSEFPAELAVTPIRLDDEREVFTATLRDITERQAAEDALRKSEARLRLALDAADLGTWDRDIEGNGFWDARCRAIYGLPAEGPLALDDIRRRVHLDDRAAVAARLAAAYAPDADGSYAAEYRVVLDSGEARWVSAYGQVLFDGAGAERQPVRFVGAVRDVTAPRRAAEALAESEARYKQLVEHSQDLIYRAGLDGRFTFVNAVAAHRTGHEPAALLGMRFSDLVAPGHRREVARFYARQLAERQPTSYFEFPIRAADGSVFWIGQNVQLIEEEGAPVGVQAVARDVTERRRVMDALVEAREAAERASRAREAFLANMSHEMRTPLNAVLGFSELIRQAGVDAEQRQLLDSLSFAADQLLALINDLLDVAKIESGQIGFERVPFDLEDVLRGVTEAVRLRAEEKGLDLAVEVGDRLPAAVVGDPVRLSQVLLNLLSNAVKFTDEGLVRFSAALAEDRDETVAVRFVVEDTGIGIPADKLPVVFERFTQARSDTTRRFGGTGLGLAIVKELTERQGGTVEVSSDEGMGTRFTVTLPFGRTDDAPELPAEEDADVAGARVLVVEDNALNQVVVQRMLEGWGAEVDVAADGRAGVDAVEAAHAAGRPFDLVLMDIQMPEMDGYDAARRIRARHSRAALPILALTASALLEQRGQMKAAGMDGLVLKPFKPAHLRRTVAAHLGRPAPPGDTPAAGAAAGAAEPSADAPPLVDLAQLEESLGGDRAFVAHLIDLFAEVASDFSDRVAAARRGGSARALAVAAHQLKSSAGLLGLRDVLDAATRTEREGQAAASDAPISPTLDALADETARATAAARDELRRLRPTYLDLP